MKKEIPQEVTLSAWQVSFDDSFTNEDARKISTGEPLPGKTYSFTLHDDEIFDLDDLRGFKAEIKSGALLCCTVEAEHDGLYSFGMGVDWWFAGFVNGECVIDLGQTGNNGSASIFRNIFRMNLRKGKNIFAACTRRGGATWDFTFMPISDNFIRAAGPALSTRYFKREISANTGLCTEPWVFTPSVHSVKVGAVFYSSVIAGIRYRIQGTKDWKELWYTAYGQKLPRENQIFELKDLAADTVYEYQILRLDEIKPCIDILYKSTFRTFPEHGEKHSFIAFSDLQTTNHARARLVGSFLKNCSVSGTDFMVSLGDVDSGMDDITISYFDAFFKPLQENHYDKPFVIVHGNHEYRGASGEFPRIFGRTFFSFRCGDVFYFVIETGEDKSMHAAPPHLYTVRTDLAEYMKEQKEWLEEVIQTPECRNAKKRIVLAHAAPFSWINTYYAEQIASSVGDVFYGPDPKCRIDLWLCGDVHTPFRFDPAAGTVYGALDKKGTFSYPYAMPEFDRKNIGFPVYINSGPSCSTVDFSMTRVDIREQEIELTMQDPDGVLLDNVVLRKGEPMEVKSSTFFRYPLQQELEAKGIPTPPRKQTPNIPWETIPFRDLTETEK